MLLKAVASPLVQYAFEPGSTRCRYCSVSERNTSASPVDVMKLSGSPDGWKVSATLAMYGSAASLTLDLARSSSNFVVPGEGANSFACGDFTPPVRYAARLELTAVGELASWSRSAFAGVRR